MKFRRTERALRVLLLTGILGGIVLICALVLGLGHLISAALAVVMFGVGGYLLLFLLLYWRGRSRIGQLLRAAEANQSAAIPGMVERMRQVDPGWLAMGGLAGLALAAATIAFAVVLLR